LQYVVLIVWPARVARVEDVQAFSAAGRWPLPARSMFVKLMKNLLSCLQTVIKCA
jgi:hypothetical protein